MYPEYVEVIWKNANSKFVCPTPIKVKRGYTIFYNAKEFLALVTADHPLYINIQVEKVHKVVSHELNAASAKTSRQPAIRLWLCRGKILF